MPPQHLLIPRTSDEQAIADCWERFVQNKLLGPIPVRSVVMESWQRCRSDGVDPGRNSAPAAADSAQIRQLRERHRHLYDAAQPVLEMLREVLRESGTIIMLTDPDGTIIDLSGDAHSRTAAERINLAPGGCWTEDVIGTNAIGTAIAAMKPVQIYATEHYCLDVKRWTCAAAPIVDPASNTLLGVLDVSGIKETFHGHSLGLVIAAAKQIESALAQRDLETHGRLLEQSVEVFTHYGSDCVILFDQHGRLLKSNGRVQMARELHGIQLPPNVGGRVEALNLTLPVEERSMRSPGWLKSEWLHTVNSREGALGTVVVVPLPARGAIGGATARRAAPVPENDPFADIIGSGAAILAAKQRARRLASLDLPVMLLGETGVGKEVFAQAIHKAGKADAPFVAVNCGALTRELLASELFGYAEGAYTGARRSGMPGKFELADGGTLFLDEIGEMPLDMQPHMLRVLQDGVVVRLGDSRERRVTVRIIAATNRDLHGEVIAGRFREDLFHRLCVTTLQLPPLRERPEDIDAIVDQMNLRLAQKYGCAPKDIAAEVRAALRRYEWPGNIRELKNVFEAMFALSDETLIDASQLPPQLTGSAPRNDAAASAATSFLVGSARLQDVEQQAVRAAIENANGNLSRAAKALGISRSTLYVKLAAMRAGESRRH